MSVGQVSSAVAGRGVDAVLAEARDVVEPAYRAVVDGMPAEVRHIAGYHAGWWDADGRPTRQAGKAVRPAVALACARAAGGVLDDAALTSGAQAGAHLAFLYGRDETWEDTAIAHVAGLVEAAGGRQWAQTEADRRIEAALTALQEARPTPAAAADLHALAALITRRDH